MQVMVTCDLDPPTLFFELCFHVRGRTPRPEYTCTCHLRPSMQQADDECEGSEKPSSAFDTESDEQEEIHDSSKSGKKKPSVLVEPCPLTLLDTRQIFAHRVIIKLGSLGRPLRTGPAPAHPARLGRQWPLLPPRWPKVLHGKEGTVVPFHALCSRTAVSKAPQTNCFAE